LIKACARPIRFEYTDTLADRAHFSNCPYTNLGGAAPIY